MCYDQLPWQHVCYEDTCSLPRVKLDHWLLCSIHSSCHVLRMMQMAFTQGLGRTCMYCGDGVNDLLALAAADVGVSVGTSNAAAGASISIPESSIAGVLSVTCVWLCHREASPHCSPLLSRSVSQICHFNASFTRMRN